MASNESDPPDDAILLDGVVPLDYATPRNKPRWTIIVGATFAGISAFVAIVVVLNHGMPIGGLAAWLLWPAGSVAGLTLTEGRAVHGGNHRGLAIAATIVSGAAFAGFLLLIFMFADD